MSTAAELVALRAEIAGIRADVAALSDSLVRIAGIFYHAGHDDALHGIPATAREPQRRGRGKLRLVR